MFDEFLLSRNRYRQSNDKLLEYSVIRFCVNRHSSIRGLLQATALKNAINTPYSYAECNNSKRIVERRRILILVIALALSCVLLGGICIGYILTEYVTEESPEQLSSSAAVTAISKMCAHIGRYVYVPCVQYNNRKKIIPEYLTQCIFNQTLDCSFLTIYSLTYLFRHAFIDN